MNFTTMFDEICPEYCQIKPKNLDLFFFGDFWTGFDPMGFITMVKTKEKNKHGFRTFFLTEVTMFLKSSW